MLKRIRKLPTAQGVASGATATFDLPLGVRYFALFLELGHAGTPDWDTDATEVRVKIDGRIQRRFTPSELDAINLIEGAQYGFQASDTILPIFFAKDWLRTLAGENAMAWGTGGIASMQIEVDLGTLTSPTLVGRALIDDQTAEVNGRIVPFPLGKIEIWDKFNFPVTNTGFVQMQNLPKRGEYVAIHAFSANITEARIFVDNIAILDSTKTIYDAILAARGKTTAAGRFDVLFDLDNQLGSTLKTVKNDGRTIDELLVEWNMGTAAGFDVITRSLDFAA